MIDDRGNVVDIYSGGDQVGRIDREAPLPGCDYGYGWEGGAEAMAIAVEGKLGDEVAIAIICDLLRNEPDAAQNARLFVSEEMK